MKKTSKIALLVILSMCWLKFHIYAFEEPIIIMKVKIIGHSSDSINPCEQKIVKELNDAIKWGNVKKVSQILDTNKNIQTKYIDEAIRTIKYYPNTKILLNLFKYRKIEINDEIIYEPDKHVSLVRYDCIKLLLKYVCGFKDVLSNEGATDEKLKLYLKAVRRNDYEMLELLGFDDESIKLPSCEGETVLTTAVRDNNVEMVKYLLEHGIDKEQREIADCFDEPMGEENAYEIAVRLGYEEIIDLLK